MCNAIAIILRLMDPSYSDYCSPVRCCNNGPRQLGLMAHCTILHSLVLRRLGKLTSSHAPSCPPGVSSHPVPVSAPQLAATAHLEVHVLIATKSNSLTAGVGRLCAAHVAQLVSKTTCQEGAAAAGLAVGRQGQSNSASVHHFE